LSLVVVVAVHRPASYNAEAQVVPLAVGASTEVDANKIVSFYGWFLYGHCWCWRCRLNANAVGAQVPTLFLLLLLLLVAVGGGWGQWCNRLRWFWWWWSGFYGRRELVGGNRSIKGMLVERLALA
jgi:hypothetical protein